MGSTPRKVIEAGTSRIGSPQSGLVWRITVMNHGPVRYEEEIAP